MLCLSVRQPWASLIFGKVPTSGSVAAERFAEHLPKCIENRDWRTQHRGWLLIHSGASPDWRWVEELFAPPRIKGGMCAKSEAVGLPLGVILGKVKLTGCRFAEKVAADAVWGMPRCYHWLLEQPVALAEPVPWKGKLGLFEVPVAAVRAEGLTTACAEHSERNGWPS